MRSTFLLYVILIFIAACGTVAHVAKDESVDLSKYHTYAWVTTTASEQEDNNRPTAFIDLSVQNEVNKRLREKGWQLTTTDPDALLSYDVLVKQTEERQSEPVYTRPFVRYYYNPFFRRWASIYYPSQFLGYTTYTVPVREATLTLTITDAKTDKVIWQGWTTENLNGSQITEEDVAKGVKRILKKL